MLGGLPLRHKSSQVFERYGIIGTGHILPTMSLTVAKTPLPVLLVPRHCICEGRGSREKFAFSPLYVCTMLQTGRVIPAGHRR
jgi:hypothetical protein